MPFKMSLKAWFLILLVSCGFLALVYSFPSYFNEVTSSISSSGSGSATSQDATSLGSQSSATTNNQGQNQLSNENSQKKSNSAAETTWSGAFATLAIFVLAIITMRYLLTENGERIKDKISHGIKSTSLNNWAVWAAIFLSISSMATTFLGMKNFHVHWIFAFVSSLGIQILLFISSWIFAEALASRRHLKRLMQDEQVDEDSFPVRQARAKSDGTVLTMSAFMVFASMGVSVFFSLDSLFDAVYLPENRELTNLKVARSDMGGVFDKLRDKVNDANADELAELVETDAWRDWTRQVNTIVNAAGNAKDTIASAVAQERSTAERNLTKALDKAGETGALVASLKARLEAMGDGGSSNSQDASQFVQRLAAKQAEISQVRAEISKLEADVSDWEAKIQEEIGAGGEDENGNRRIAGCGPVCRDYKREQVAVTSRLESRKPRLVALEKDLAEIQSEKEGALSSREKIADSLSQAQIADDAAKAARDAAQTVYSRVFAGGADTPDPSQAGGAIDVIRSSINEFQATAQASKLNPAIASCETIFSTLNSNPTTRSAVANVSCDVTSIAPTLDRMSALETAHETMGTDCRVDNEFIQFASVKPMIDKARKCISLSGLPYEAVAAERNLADKVEQENSENSSRFEITLSTLTRGDLLSWLTLFIAFSIDLFVLGSAIVGARTMESVLEEDGDVGSRSGLERIELLQFANASVRPSDPPNIKTQKHFLTALEHNAVDHSGKSEQFLDLNSDRVHSWGEQAAKTLNLQMSSLVAQGLASPVSGRSGCYTIKQNYVSHVTFQVARYEQDYYAKSGSTIDTNPDNDEPPSTGRRGRRRNAHQDEKRTDEYQSGRTGNERQYHSSVNSTGPQNRSTSFGFADKWRKAMGGKPANDGKAREETTRESFFKRDFD